MTASCRIAVFALMFVALCGCGRAPRPATALLFIGSGTSVNGARAMEAVLDREHVDYATADSAQLNAMTLTQLRAYRLIVVPGGNFIDMAAALRPATTTRVRQAVQQGTNYLGICAGGFLAGDTRRNSFNLTGVHFPFYAIEAQGVRKAAVAITTPDGPILDQYWEEGPQFTGWGDVAGRYPDGTPAIVEGTAGGGWVVLSGIHPEAPESWRRGMDFRTSTEEDNAYAKALVRSALTRSALPHF